MSIAIKKLDAADTDLFVGLIRVFEKEFEMKDLRIPSTDYLSQLLIKTDFFVFVALENGNVVGGLTSYLFDQYYNTTPLVYIYDLAVLNDFQRRGIGKQLIEAHNDFCKQLNAEVVMVEADETDKHAIEFYRSTGATGLNVVHFDYNLSE